IKGITRVKIDLKITMLQMDHCHRELYLPPCFWTLQILTLSRVKHYKIYETVKGITLALSLE
ncbi:MAG: hypothetical protein ACK56F_21640, partial [bacterium]